MLRRILQANQLPRDGWIRNVLVKLQLLPGSTRYRRLSEFAHDPSLGDHLDLVFTVKHQQQVALNRIMRRRLRGGQPMKALGGHTPRPYREGLLVQCALRNGALQQMDLKEPFGLDQHGSRLAVAAGNEVHVYDTETEQTHVFCNPWFAQLHSTYFSPDGTRLLVVATGFDTVLEFDVATHQLTYAWNAWEHGYDLSPAGIRIRRHALPKGRNPRRSLLVDDPAAWNGFGLPTGLTAAHLNNARYGSRDSILVTLFHQGCAIVTDRSSGARREVLRGCSIPTVSSPELMASML